jgi:mono/diheme cytochrome c family protein
VPRPIRILRRALALGTLATAVLTAGTAHAEALTLTDAVYSKAQAKVGRKLFESHCATCHATDYFDGVFRAWSGETVASLFDVMAGTMPQSNPGSLRDQEYLDVLAYILKENDFPAGDDDLGSEAAQLDAVLIVRP